MISFISGFILGGLTSGIIIIILILINEEDD